jgi:hypothetical protein
MNPEFWYDLIAKEFTPPTGVEKSTSDGEHDHALIQKGFVA